jgi:hypothetical protein
MKHIPGENRPIKKSGGHDPVHFATRSIPLFSGRPARHKVIGRDDLVDLDILLNTCVSVEDFVAKA